MRPRLVIGIGNPSRGDDAIGPICIERLQAANLPDVELLTDFQLQVEYVIDLHGRREVIIVDAAASGPVPHGFDRIRPDEDTSYSSHALSPQALLVAYERHYGVISPPAYLLAIRGYQYELGEALSPAAEANLDSAMAFLLGRLSIRHSQNEQGRR